MDKTALLKGALILHGHARINKRAGEYVDPGIARIEKLIKDNPDALNKTSPCEWGARVLGGTGGALLGYWLAGKIHEKPRKLTRLLYTLGGGAAGAYLGDSLISDKARLSARLEAAFSGNKEYSDAKIEARRGTDPVKLGKAEVIGTGAGGVVGYGVGGATGEAAGHVVGQASRLGLKAAGRALSKSPNAYAKVLGHAIYRSATPISKGVGRAGRGLGKLIGTGVGGYAGYKAGEWVGTDKPAVTDIMGALMDRGISAS